MRLCQSVVIRNDCILASLAGQLASSQHGVRGPSTTPGACYGIVRSNMNRSHGGSTTPILTWISRILARLAARRGVFGKRPGGTPAFRQDLVVCDAGGRLMAFNRMDGAIWASVYGCQGKALVRLPYGFDKSKKPGMVGPGYSHCFHALYRAGLKPCWKDFTPLRTVGF